MAVGAGLAGVISGDDPPGAEWSLSMIEIKRILVPIDFSDHSRHALDHAVAMARWYDSTITLLHVYSTVPVAAYAPGTTMHPSVAMTPMDRDALLALMRRFAEDEAGADRPIQCETCEGAAAAETLARAKALPADLIVMGTHGRSGFERLLLGSVTEKVLRKASCPVLSVPRGARDAVPALPVLDVVDARTNRLIWRGWAQHGVRGMLESQDTMARQIDEAVTRMCTRFSRPL